jgi:hypothetical protein
VNTVPCAFYEAKFGKNPGQTPYDVIPPGLANDLHFYDYQNDYCNSLSVMCLTPTWEVECSLNYAAATGGRRQARAIGEEHAMAKRRLGSKLDATWSAHLELVASGGAAVREGALPLAAEQPVPAADSIVLFLETYNTAEQMEAQVNGLRQKVPQMSVHRPSLAAPGSATDGSAAGSLEKKLLTQRLMLSAPDGVAALRPLGMRPVKDVAMEPLAPAEVIAMCHTRANSDPKAFGHSADPKMIGLCHSSPTAGKTWVTKTLLEDGRVLPLVWTCHAVQNAGEGVYHCHVSEEALLAPSTSHAALLRK